MGWGEVGVELGGVGGREGGGKSGVGGRGWS